MIARITKAKYPAGASAHETATLRRTEILAELARITKAIKDLDTGKIPCSGRPIDWADVGDLGSVLMHLETTPIYGSDP